MTTLKLDTPLKKGEVTIEELTFKDPKVGHLLVTDGLDPNSTAFVLALASSLTGVPELMLKVMEPDDWAKVRTEVRLAYNRFLGVSRGAIAAAMALELSPEEFGQLIRVYARDRDLKLGTWLVGLVEDAEQTP